MIFGRFCLWFVCVVSVCWMVLFGSVLLILV